MQIKLSIQPPPHTHTHTHTHNVIHTHAHNAHTHMHTLTHTHTHTHTPSLPHYVDGDNQDPKPKGKESDIVFCEATKQLLIEKPPPLFTLHLKRFIQNGRRLRKNNRHVSFPTVLDISPFCVDDCKVSFC